MLAMAVNLPDGLNHLNWVDYVFLVVMVYSVVSGAWIGFFAETVSLAGVAAGTFAAGLTFHQAGLALSHVGVQPDSQDWAGFVGVFVAISLVFRICSLKARRLSKILVQGKSNELAGALLGLIVGAIICLFAFVTVTYFHIGKVTDSHGHQVPGNLEVSFREAKIAISSKNLVQEYVTMLPEKMHTIRDFAN